MDTVVDGEEREREKKGRKNVEGKYELKREGSVKPKRKRKRLVAMGNQQKGRSSGEISSCVLGTHGTYPNTDSLLMRTELLAILGVHCIYTGGAFYSSILFVRFVFFVSVYSSSISTRCWRYLLGRGDRRTGHTTL